MHRVAREELEGTLKELLTVNDQARSTAVHETCKHLKKVRALIRLLRPVTGESFYKLENAVMRKAAERMSSIRDSHVRVQTIEKLIVKSGKRRAPAAFARIRTAMAARLRQMMEESEKEDWSKQAAVEIERRLGRLDEWPLKRLTKKSIRSGLKAACKKARRVLAVARRTATDANLHELRKRVKDLWYDLRLLGGGRPPPLQALTKRLRDLGQKLGDDHDLAMLLAARADNPLPEARGLGDARKSNRLSSSAIAAGRTSFGVEGPDSRTGSIRRFRRRSLGDVALLSREKVTYHAAPSDS